MKERSKLQFGKKLLLFVCINILLVICYLVISNILTSKSTINTDNLTESAKVITNVDASVPQDSVVTMCAVGDNLAHTTVYNPYKTEDGYDFHSIYSEIKDSIESYDIAVINQETVLVDHNNVSSYPCFGTPYEMADAISDTGFDVVLQATNHTMDKGIAGVQSTLDIWKNYPNIKVLGIHDTEEDANTIDIVEKNGIKFAMFNYTYGTNGISIPSESDYMIDTLDDKDKFLSDIKTAESEADFTICFLHIGTEYVYEPTGYQVDYINDVIDAGADVVICAHPHVVEPCKQVTTNNGNSAIVYYSCGNFVSGQDELPRLLGGMAAIQFRKTADGDCVIDNEKFIPLVCHRTPSEVKVYKLCDYTDELASQHSVSGVTADKLWDLWNNIMINY